MFRTKEEQNIYLHYRLSNIWKQSFSEIREEKLPRSCDSLELELARTQF